MINILLFVFDEITIYKKKKSIFVDQNTID